MIWVSDPRSPGTATAITPQADYNFGCQWAPDGKTFVYQSATGSAPTEPWVANTSKPGVVSRLIAPRAAGATLPFLGVAKKTSRAVAGVQSAAVNATNFYLSAVDAPGPGTLFFTATTVLLSAFAMDANGTSIQLLSRDPVNGSAQFINHLHWVSTQVNGDDLVVSRPDSTTGVLQSAFVPE
jgi:hypothetical protein